jgi:Flp pilus assembly protein TadG
MKVFNLARHWFWLAPVVLGIAFMAGGLYMVSQGRDAKDEVRDAIIRENITTSEDASIPNVQVNSAATAKAQAQAIEAHTLETTEGETYATIDRYLAPDGGTTNDREAALKGADGNPIANPARNTAFQSAALRTSLNLAVMGFKVSDLVIGMGFFMVAVGATFVLFLAPAVYYAAELANKRTDEEPRREAAPVTT